MGSFAWIIYSFTSFYLLHSTNSEIICPFHSLYQFGDSTADTGNLIRVPVIGHRLPAARLPYGETFPGRPTGRWSDGLLLTDFMAAALRLPLLHPYNERKASFTYGVNFAVAGSTALDISFLASRGVIIPSVIAPLSLQLNWFRTHVNSICSTPRECKDKLKRALFIIGDIGNNDIAFGFSQGRSLREVQDYVPFIAEAIANGTREAIRLGAIRLVVPGAFPLGCLPLFLNSTFSIDRTLDEFGCLRVVNDLSEFLNNNIKQRLKSLRNEFPDVVILYADNYNALLTVFRRAPYLGFDKNTLLKTCCGVGGNSFDSDKFCGSPGVPLCQNPGRYINWDGIHYTQEAHRRLSEILIPDILLRIQCFQ